MNKKNKVKTRPPMTKGQVQVGKVYETLHEGENRLGIILGNVREIFMGDYL